jgi:DNA processing protein
MSTLNKMWWHALNLCIDGELWRFWDLAAVLGGPEQVFKLSKEQLREAGLGDDLLERWAFRKNLIKPEESWASLGRMGMHAIGLGEPGYPKALAQTHSAPPIIYVRGDLSVLDGKCLAVVGSRKMTSYGKQAVAKLVPPLVNVGVTIVSGMALGIDGEALNACMINGGKPVAVLASSLDYSEVNPRAHWHMAKKIELHGCLISENPPGRPAHKFLFPARNRIVSGLSQGTLVVEAGLPSGSLITARLALDQNREVFAVPGSILSGQSAGTNDLIKRGAKAVTSPQDIAQEFGWDIEAPSRQLPLQDPIQNAVLELLQDEPASAESLVRLTNYSAGQILAALTELEVSGTIERSIAGIYARIK